MACLRRPRRTQPGVRTLRADGWHPRRGARHELAAHVRRQHRALAVATGSALSGYTGEAQILALVALTFLVGVIQLVLGLLRLGAVTRFVSNAVMTGFMTAVMVRIILSQLGDLSGYRGAGGNPVLQALDLLRNVASVTCRRWPSACWRSASSSGSSELG